MLNTPASVTIDTAVVEVVMFKLQPGIDRQTFMDVAVKTHAIISGFDGYVHRQLSEHEGQWLDLVWWTSREQAFTAGQVAMQMPELAPFMTMLDPNSVIMFHLDPVALTR